MPQSCPCSPQRAYADCCAPFHRGSRLPENAEQLMRSRYSAYVLQQVDYLLTTTVPAQQAWLDRAAIQTWSQTTQWAGLTVLSHRPHAGKHHALVAFNADFDTPQGRQSHHEVSVFVHVAGRWYFIDPTVPLPGMKQPCVCGSGKKFIHCCGALLNTAIS